MIYAVYRIEDGTLVSVTADASCLAGVSVLGAKGYAVKELDIPAWDAGGVWDKANLAFAPRPPEEQG